MSIDYTDPDTVAALRTLDQSHVDLEDTIKEAFMPFMGLMAQKHSEATRDMMASLWNSIFTAKLTGEELRSAMGPDRGFVYAKLGRKSGKTLTASATDKARAKSKAARQARKTTKRKMK